MGRVNEGEPREGSGKHIHTLGTNEREIRRKGGKGGCKGDRGARRRGTTATRPTRGAAVFFFVLTFLCLPSDHTGDRRRPSIDSTMSDGPVTPSDEEPNGYCYPLISISLSKPSLILLITITSTDSLIFTRKLPCLRPTNR